MKHVHAITRVPAAAVTTEAIPVGTLIDFIIALLQAFKPILVLKYGTTTE